MKILIPLIFMIVNCLNANDLIYVNSLNDLTKLSFKDNKNHFVKVLNPINGGEFIHKNKYKNKYKKGLIYNGWIRKDFFANPKILKLQWFLNNQYGQSGEPNKETKIDHTKALLELFKNIENGMTVYFPNGVFYSTKELSCAGKHYVNFVGTGYALQQNSYFSSNTRLQYRGHKKNAVFIDAGKHPSFRNISIWGNGCSTKWGYNHLQNSYGTIGLKVEGSLNAINLQLKYHKVAIYFWKDSFYTRTNNLEIKYADLAFAYKQTPYNQKHFGAIFQEVSKIWDKSGRSFSFIGCSFEHYSKKNIVYPGTKVTFSNCYFETTKQTNTFLRLEKRASLAIRDSMVYTKNTRFFIDNSHGYYSVFISDNNTIVNDKNKLSSYIKLSTDEKGQIIKLFGDQLEYDYPFMSHYINILPKGNTYKITLPKGVDLFLDDGKKIVRKKSGDTYETK